jgi:hypothetical protein
MIRSRVSHSHRPTLSNRSKPNRPEYDAAFMTLAQSGSELR